MAQLKDLLVNGKSKFLDMVTAIGMKLPSGGSNTTFWNTNGGTNTASEIVSAGGDTRYVRKDVDSTLDNTVTTTWYQYGERKLTISGTSILLNMRAASESWADSFFGLQDYDSDGNGNAITHDSAAFGFYGGSSAPGNKAALKYFYLGGSYSDPVAKLYPNDTNLGMVARFEINKAGNIAPRTTTTYNLGSTDKYWNNIYTKDIYLSRGAKSTSWASEDKVWNTNGGIRDITTFVAADNTALVTSGAVWTAINNIPADTKVKQIITSSSNTDYRPVILGASSSASATPIFSDTTNLVYAAHNVYMQPASGNIINKGGNIKLESASSTAGCVMSYDSTEECMKFTFN